MRGAVLLAVFFTCAAPAVAERPTADSWSWDQWRRLPVQEGGRQKPLDTLARETLQALGNRRSIRDPETHEKLDPVAWYLTAMLDWQGWRETANSETANSHLAAPGATTATYFQTHKADKWDRMPMFRVDRPELREALGIPHKLDVSALELYEAHIHDSEPGERTPLLLWANRRSAQARWPLPRFEESAVRLASMLRLYQAHRMGLILQVLPKTTSSLQEWFSVNQLWNSHFDDESDPKGVLRGEQQSLRELHAAFKSGSPGQFNRATANFISRAISRGSELGLYPDLTRIDLELAYNQWKPFRVAWVLVLCALVSVYLRGSTGNRVYYYVAVAALGAGLVLTLFGITVRIIISGRAPVTNMYESVIFVALGTGLFGLLLDLRRRGSFIIGASSAITLVALLLADFSPAVLDPSIRPLLPALRDNFWLAVHVLTVTLSYSAFALALGIGNISLGFFTIRTQNWDTINTLTILNRRCLRVGVTLLAIGTVTGGIWADLCWGRFWGWDPKEVWALITLLAYLAVLHARHVNWVGHFGLAALSVICFSLVVIAWYGVNFVLGSGLHSYGSGQGGTEYVIGLLFVQFFYVAIAAARSAGRGMGSIPEP